MDWAEEMKQEQAILKSSADKLLAMARLAKRVAFLPMPIRCFVLWILRPAEAAAFDYYVVDLGYADHLSPDMLYAHEGSSRDDALRLAESFCLLATIVTSLVHACPDVRDDPHPASGEQASGQPEAVLTDPHTPKPDTAPLPEVRGLPRGFVARQLKHFQ